MSIAKPGEAGCDLDGTINRTVYLGTDTHYLVGLDNGPEITVRTRNAHHATLDLAPGDRAALRIDEGAARLLVD